MLVQTEMGNDGKVIGLIEIKCLKILKETSVGDLVKEKNGGEIPSYVLNNQCFTFDGNNLKLRESHIYYYQVQLHMLVTDLNFCDFVLHSPKGSPSIQRITRDEKWILAQSFGQCCNSYICFVTCYSYSYIARNVTSYRYKLQMENCN